MNRVSLAAAVLALCFAGPLWACDKEGKVVKAGSQVPPCCQAKIQAAMAKVMKDVPSMAYRVGDFDTRCLQSATAKAGADGKVQFVVAEKAYDSETEATVALADLLEQRIENFKTVRLAVGEKTFYCPISARAACKKGQKVKYRLAGYDFDTKEKADLALTRINYALNGCKKDKATVVGAGAWPCNKAAGAKVASVKGKYPCGKAKTATVAAAKKSPCGFAKTTTVAAAEKSPWGKARSATVASAEKSPCGKARTATVAAAEKSPCGKAKTTTVAAAEKSPCGKAKATTVAAQTKGGCCKKAKQRLASAQDQIRLILETATSIALSS